MVFPTDREEQGLGDVSLSATWSFNDIASTRLFVDVTARVRLPTGDEVAGLGNGTTDYATLAEIGWDGRKGGVFLNGGRRFLEAKPGVNRVDGWQASAGMWRHIGRISTVGAQASWRNASIEGGEDPQSIDVYLSRRLSTGWKFSVSAGAGLSDANPDYSVGLNFTWRKSTRR